MKEADTRLLGWNVVHEKRNIMGNAKILLKLQVLGKYNKEAIMYYNFFVSIQRTCSDFPPIRIFV